MQCLDGMGIVVAVPREVSRVGVEGSQWNVRVYVVVLVDAFGHVSAVLVGVVVGVGWAADGVGDWVSHGGVVDGRGTLGIHPPSLVSVVPRLEVVNDNANGLYGTRSRHLSGVALGVEGVLWRGGSALLEGLLEQEIRKIIKGSKVLT